MGDFFDQAFQKYQQQAPKARGKGGGTAADNSASLQGKGKEVTERGAVRCTIAEMVPNHEEQHKDREAILIEAALQGALEVPSPSSNHWDRLPGELQEFIMRMVPPSLKTELYVKMNLLGWTVCLSDVVLSGAVWVFKKQIAAKTGVPAADQRLIFGGRELENRHPLTKYGLSKESNTVRNWGASCNITRSAQAPRLTPAVGSEATGPLRSPSPHTQFFYYTPSNNRLEALRRTVSREEERLRVLVSLGEAHAWRLPPSHPMYRPVP